MKTQATSDKQQATGWFQVLRRDAPTQARLGRLKTSHGIIDTPCFMPCATQGTVKALSGLDLTEMDAHIILSNVYHLYLRPGKEILASLGGLHRFMNWKGAILTDSGGFQVFSLSERRKVTEGGVTFQSHLDGATVFLSPEEVIRFQRILGSDILMPLDECVAYPVEKRPAREAMERTVRWAERSKREFQRQETSDKRQLFGIVQGSTYLDLRKECCERLIEIGFDGYAVGGLSVGEPKELQWEILNGILNGTKSLLGGLGPGRDRCLYLMGVGTPPDILEAVSMGVDLFDCVLPTRNGRNGQAFTKYGKLNLRNAQFAKDQTPLEEGCLCKACQNHSRAYLHHLVRAKEILGAHLLTLHNLYFYLSFMRQIQGTLRNGQFLGFKKNFLESYQVKEEDNEE